MALNAVDWGAMDWGAMDWGRGLAGPGGSKAPLPEGPETPLPAGPETPLPEGPETLLPGRGLKRRCRTVFYAFPALGQNMNVIEVDR